MGDRKTIQPPVSDVGEGYSHTGLGGMRLLICIWRGVTRTKASFVGFSTLVVLYLVAAFAGPIAPYNYTSEAHDQIFCPPMLSRIHLLDENGSICRPYVYAFKSMDIQERSYIADHTRKYPMNLFVKGDRYSVLGIVEWDVHLFGVEKPGRLYLLGADHLGRDLFSRIIFGSQVSLTIGIFGILISSLIGMLIGGIAGFLGGITDFIIMRFSEILLAIPGIYFALIVRQSFGSELHPLQVYFIIIFVLAMIGWATDARVVRGMVLSIKEQDFIQAARALGVGRARILFRHILPGTLSYVIVMATLSVPFYIFGEVALSFLGVGIQEPYASWGSLLGDAQNIRYLVDFPWVLTPGLFVFITVAAWNLVGDSLREYMDPGINGNG